MIKNRRWLQPFLAPSLILISISISLIFFAAVSTCSAADDQGVNPQQTASPDSSLYVKVRLDHPVKMCKLKPGGVVSGRLSRDVYSADRELFPAGSVIRLTVDHLEKRRRPRNDHWPWVVNAFTPRHQPYPVFNTANVMQGTAEIPLHVSLLSVSRLREVHAQAKKQNKDQKDEKDDSGNSSTPEAGAVEVNKTDSRQAPTPTMVLEASLPGNQPAVDEAKGKNAGNTTNEPASEANSEPGAPIPETIPAATRCKILLLGDVSASKSMPGDIVRARLLEPVLLNSKVILPAGSLFEGKVVKKTPPRWLSRAGSLYLSFTELTLPGGNHIPISASLAGAELDRRSHTKIDAEGQFRGQRPGKVWMAINLAVTAGLAKEADDTLQIIVEAIVSTATDASTAGIGRIASSCVSGIYMVTRHGRDVVLPRFTEMDISLDRPLSIGPPSAAPTAPAGGK